MHKDIKKQKMTSQQLVFLAHQTCQWWNAVFIQAKRFLDALEKNHGNLPWEENCIDEIFIPERMFLITAIYHAIENLQKLNIEIHRGNDMSLDDVLKSIETVAPFDDIKNLRDMNEHGLDYLMDLGKKQKQYCTTLKDGKYIVHTQANMTYINGDSNRT